MCDLVSHDRPGHEPLPDPASAGVLSRAHPDRAPARPRKGRGKKGHGNTYAKRIAVLAAYAAANTDTFLTERFRRLAARPGGGGRKKAGCARGPARPDHRLAPAERPRRPLEALGYDVIITLREDAA
jgi:hypothetical protein